MNSAKHSALDPKYWHIPKLDNSTLDKIKHRIDNKTKPLGALGKLEALAQSIALIQGQQTHSVTQIDINQPCILIFAADHGIAQHPISIAPREVTGQMVLNFLAGGAAINCFCRTSDVQLKVIDAGVLTPVTQTHADFIQQSVAAGTQDFSVAAAMTAAQLEQALVYGQTVAQQQIDNGSNLIGFGEMGIGNTTSASALLSVLTGLPANQTAGKGTGIDAQQLSRKIDLIDLSMQRVEQIYGQLPLTPIQALQEVGGFEIAQIVGAMLTTARAGKTIIVDGFIVSIAALLSCQIQANARDFMIFAHSSAEQAHSLVLDQLKATPLLNLDMRLGEGTGAALAVPLIRAAAEFYNNMATFESAQVNV
ncbi:nicotinate-nucleotide--dimethylbenzimidazole phosphoribosyltransferase [Paraglaciecola aquimarina]|uniref:Nicotinate-nucleotide--dimethylbenzimidazole phosphoribosyltransferase n=1 Tax=Paraglaciecola algarum TaxID=3050085 RepID=A0ABS9DAV7_9ALTE|nr:nicotinate-nucleotide--dimethylbenzimidazole phosphoribosyltransferase [Paraglaciecola sp. G1-23]MCF2949864.1 nicotinate-nucleotide--dimethylbenzimidazole phosphoribosyltransferase [Paraglaciecola sp. G1-23]